VLAQQLRAENPELSKSAALVMVMTTVEGARLAMADRMARLGH